MTTNAIGRALTGHLSTPRQPGPVLQIDPALVDAKAGARLMSISVRKFHALRPELPPPVVLGARVVRWKTAELRRYVESLAAAHERTEPPQLAAARISRRDVAAFGARAEGSAAAGPEVKSRRGVGKRPVQSNPQVDTVTLPLPGIEG